MLMSNILGPSYRPAAYCVPLRPLGYVTNFYSTSVQQRGKEREEKEEKGKEVKKEKEKKGERERGERNGKAVVVGRGRD